MGCSGTFAWLAAKWQTLETPVVLTGMQENLTDSLASCSTTWVLLAMSAVGIVVLGKLLRLKRANCSAAHGSRGPQYQDVDHPANNNMNGYINHNVGNRIRPYGGQINKRPNLTSRTLKLEDEPEILKYYTMTSAGTYNPRL